MRIDSIDNHPDIIAVCTSCTRPRCPGVCERYNEKYRELAGLDKQAKRVTCKGSIPRAEKLYTANGETHTLKEWAAILGRPYSTLWCRVNKSQMPIDIALSRKIYTKER